MRYIECFCHSSFCHLNLFRISIFGFRIFSDVCFLIMPSGLKSKPGPRDPDLYSSPFLFRRLKPRPLGGVRVVWLCLLSAFEIAVAEGHKSVVRPRPLAVDSPIQAIFLLVVKEILGCHLSLSEFSPDSHKSQDAGTEEPDRAGDGSGHPVNSYVGDGTILRPKPQ